MCDHKKCDFFKKYVIFLLSVVEKRRFFGDFKEKWPFHFVTFQIYAYLCSVIKSILKYIFKYMKNFFKYMLATIAGIVVLSIIITLIGIGSLASMIATSETATRIHQPSIFELKLEGTVYERNAPNPLADFMPEEQSTLGLDDILRAIDKATAEPNIKGIYLEAKGLTASPATLSVIRNALLNFKESGKFVVAYSDTYDQSDYYICSVADKVILNPQGHLDWHGLSSQNIFFKDAMKQFGIEMQIFKVGTYKSAVEPFLTDKMSDANREQVTAFLTTLWDVIVNDVSASRNIDAATLNTYADSYLLFDTPEEVVAKGMADTLLYMDGVKSYLQELMDVKGKLPIVTLEEVKNIDRKAPLDKSGNVIAVYYAQGNIVQTPSETNFMGTPEIASDKVIKDLAALRDDESVKAVVFRVNSGGGSAYASEQIWREVVRLKEKKPVIVSMGDMAASGGYYISCAADTIVAQPNTLTGSIGIFGMIPCAESLMQDKLKLHFDGVKTNALSDFGKIHRTLTDDEKTKIQKTIEKGYQTFIARCADGRGLTTEAIDAIGQGRVWTGQAALELGLVDVLGDLKTAEAIAAEKAGIESWSLVSYPALENTFTSLFNKTRQGYLDVRMQKALGEYAEGFLFFSDLTSMDPIQARMPFTLTIR